MTLLETRSNQNAIIPCVMTIAGFDPSGGAGLQADMKTVHALGGYAFTVPTALTIQNSQGVLGFEPVDVHVWRAQAHAILDDVQIHALKLGMLATADTVSAVADLIEHYAIEQVVLDPVLVSSSGALLLEKDALEVMKKRLLPKVSVITPNLPEAEVLLSPNVSFSDNRDAALSEHCLNEVLDAFVEMGVAQVVLKGGHGPDTSDACDYLLTKQSPIKAFCSARISGVSRHGTGCTFASALATYLAQGHSLQDSVSQAKSFMNRLLTLKAGTKFPFHHPNVPRQWPLRHELSK